MSASANLLRSGGEVPHDPKLAEIAERALTIAKKAGADAGDAMVQRSTDFEVKVADGAIITLTQATAKGLGLRVFVEGRMGFCTTSDFNPESLELAVRRAVAFAREAAADPHNGLGDASPGLVTADALDLYDPAVAALPAETKIEWAHELERAARAADKRVLKFRDSGIATSDAEAVLATTGGAVRTRRSTAIQAWCNPIATQDGELQTELWYDAQTHLEDLEPIATIGATAGLRAARMLGAKPVKTQEAAIIFEPPAAAALVAGMLGAINGDMVYKKASFLAEKLGEVIASPLLSLVDDPLLARGLESSPFDGEGTATAPRRILDGGKLTTFLYDSYTARKASARPTASARRSYSGLPHVGAFNLYVERGSAALDEILHSVDRALVVTRGLGSGLNPVSGEYSRGVNGLWFERGEIAHPVQEVTIAGDFLTMLKAIDRVGSDWMMRGATGAPTLRIASMTISGS